MVVDQTGASRVRPTGARRCSVFDHGLTVGDGVFETLKVVRDTPFAMRRHLARLRHSARGLSLDVPLSDDELRVVMADVVAAGGGEVGRLRITLTGGTAPLGSGRDDVRPTLIVAGAPLEPWPATTAVVTVPWPRNEQAATAGLKTTSYADNVVALAQAHQAGATEAILPNTTGALCEGTGTNVFVVVSGLLVTPPLSSGCLAGVTRALVCELTGAEERAAPIEVLRDAEEVFLTSSTRDIHPVHQVDDRPLPAPGPLTKKTMAAFEALVSRDLDP